MRDVLEAFKVGEKDIKDSEVHVHLDRYPSVIGM
jgi:hypothetical protein